MNMTYRIAGASFKYYILDDLLAGLGYTILYDKAMEHNF
jgi:hypothetical protein